MSQARLIDFVYHEARLLDEKRWDEWYALFTDDAFYWVPLTHEQPDGVNHTSLAYEDKLLLQLRIERLRRHPFSQQPVSRSQHVLQRPEIEQADDTAGQWVLRTAFYYAEARLDAMQFYTGVVFHHLVRVDDALRIRLKRVNLLNCDAALPSIQLFL
jgi:3-phenylpropionate/cinnamic acid dioxygenase small subunit